ncbi:hypothetical protein LCGC14_1592470, partial [marine sediment metagenome]
MGLKGYVREPRADARARRNSTAIADQDPVYGAGGIFFDPGGDVDSDLLTVDVTGMPVLLWDESEDDFVFSHSLTIGVGLAGEDYSLTFDGEDADGILAWLEDEAQFSFSSGLLIAGYVFITNTNGLIVGHTAQIDFGATPELQVLGTATPDSSMGFARFENNASGPDVRFLKSRGSTIGTNTIVQDGDTLGRFRFQAADGVDFNTPAAEISAEVDGTPGAND